MARISLFGTMRPNAGAFFDLVSGQITSATTPSVGDTLCLVLPAGGDYGGHGRFDMPGFSGTPTVVFKGILDGAPGAADTLGFGFRKYAAADNETGDATFAAEQTVSATIGSNGSGHANEDVVVLAVTLTPGDYAAGDEVQFFAYIDDSGSSYAGNFLLQDVLLDYTPA